MKQIFISFLLFFVWPIMAEYRVYQYLVIPSPPIKSVKSKPFFELSTLDPVAYVSYYGGLSQLRVELLRTWICPGYTGQSDEYCSNPYANLDK